MNPPQPGIESDKRQYRSLIAGALVGSALEWYDFFIYGFVAGLVFNKVFFPNLSPTLGTILAFGSFAAGWLARPIGGIVAGHLGDRVGRKATMLVGLSVMGSCTVLMGLLPSYATIGIWAPILLVSLRVLQGLAVGAEYGPSVLTAIEHAPPDKRCWYGAWPNLGVITGVSIGVFLTLISSTIPGDALEAWAWRVPFLFSAVMVVIGVVVRLHLPETPIFAAMQEAQEKRQAEQPKIPLFEVLRRHRTSLLAVVLSLMSTNTFFFTYITFLGSYAVRYELFTSTEMLTAVLVATVLEVGAIRSLAKLADQIGVAKMFLIGIVGLGVTAYPFFVLLKLGSFPVLLVSMIVVISVFHAAQFAALPALLAGLFPPAVRATGFSVGWQVGGTLFAAPLPALATALVSYLDDGQPWLLAGYLVFAACVSAGSVALMKPAPDAWDIPHGDLPSGLSEQARPLHTNNSQD